MTGSLISANYGEINSGGEALAQAQRQLTQMTEELNQQLQRAEWVSQSDQAFQAIMNRYNQNMAELHRELHQLGNALVQAGAQLDQTDRHVASHTFG